MARVLCVYDEGSIVDTPLIGAKGFSVLVESDGKRVLFDVGLRDRYLTHNMEHLQIEPDSLDAIVLSQACPDNCRAINGLLDSRRDPVEIYAPSGLLDGKKGFLSRSVGLTEENREKAVVHDIEGWIEVIPDVWVSPQIGYDDGSSESIMVVGSKVLISGRGIQGPAPLLEMAYGKFGRYPRTFIGAVLLEKRKKPVAQAYAQKFDECGCTDLHLNHCVGRDGMTNLRAHFGLKGVDEFYVGMEYRI